MNGTSFLQVLKINCSTLAYELKKHLIQPNAFTLPQSRSFQHNKTKHNLTHSRKWKLNFRQILKMGKFCATSCILIFTLFFHGLNSLEYDTLEYEDTESVTTTMPYLIQGFEDNSGEHIDEMNHSEDEDDEYETATEWVWMISISVQFAQF